MTETAELAVVNTQNAVEIFTKGGLGAILDGVEKKVRAMSLDASTATGREEIRSVAYKVTRTKTALDAEAKKLTEGWRTATSQVNAERKQAQERLEALAEEVRAPLTAFENKEKARIAAHEAALTEISGLLEMLRTYPNMEVALLLDHQLELSGLHNGRAWEEFEYRAKKLRVEAFLYLDNRIATRKQFDADQAELARLRKEDADRLVREREANLKSEAANSARIEAESRAKETADAEAKRVIDAANKERDRVNAEAERVRADNERAQKNAEAARKSEQEARELAEKRAQEAERAQAESSRKAEADKKVAEAKAAEALKAAKDKAKDEADAAIAKERERVERQRKSEDEARTKRESDQKLRAKVRAEIKADIESLDATIVDIESFIDAIMDGKVRHVRVAF